MKFVTVIGLVTVSVVLSVVATLFACNWMIEQRFQRVGAKLEREQVLEQRLDALSIAVEKMNSRDVLAIGHEVEDRDAILRELVRIKTALAVAHIQF